MSIDGLQRGENPTDEHRNDSPATAVVRAAVESLTANDFYVPNNAADGIACYHAAVDATILESHDPDALPLSVGQDTEARHNVALGYTQQVFLGTAMLMAAGVRAAPELLHPTAALQKSKHTILLPADPVTESRLGLIEAVLSEATVEAAVQFHAHDEKFEFSPPAYARLIEFDDKLSKQPADLALRQQKKTARQITDLLWNPIAEAGYGPIHNS